MSENPLLKYLSKEEEKKEPVNPLLKYLEEPPVSIPVSEKLFSSVKRMESSIEPTNPYGVNMPNKKENREKFVNVYGAKIRPDSSSLISFKDSETGERVGRNVVSNIWNESGGDPATFYSKYSGLPVDSPQVKSFVKIYGEPKKPTKFEPQLQTVAPESTTAPLTTPIQKEKPKEPSFAETMMSYGVDLGKVYPSAQKELEESTLYGDVVKPIDDKSKKRFEQKETEFEELRKLGYSPSFREWTQNRMRRLFGVEAEDEHTLANFNAGLINGIAQLPLIPAEITEAYKESVKDKGFIAGTGQTLVDLLVMFPVNELKMISYAYSPLANEEQRKEGLDHIYDDPLMPVFGALMVYKLPKMPKKVLKKFQESRQYLSEVIEIDRRLAGGEKIPLSERTARIIAKFRSDPKVKESVIDALEDSKPLRSAVEIAMEGEVSVKTKTAGKGKVIGEKTKEGKIELLGSERKRLIDEISELDSKMESGKKAGEKPKVLDGLQNQIDTKVKRLNEIGVEEIDIVSKPELKKEVKTREQIDAEVKGKADAELKRYENKLRELEERQIAEGQPVPSGKPYTELALEQMEREIREKKKKGEMDKAEADAYDKWLEERKGLQAERKPLPDDPLHPAPKGEGKQVEVKSIKEKAEVKAEDKPFKRTKDFMTEGTYEGVIDGKTYKIYRDALHDPSYPVWLDSKTGDFLGYTKAEAINKLKTKSSKQKPIPPKPVVIPKQLKGKIRAELRGDLQHYTKMVNTLEQYGKQRKEGITLEQKRRQDNNIPIFESEIKRIKEKASKEGIELNAFIGIPTPKMIKDAVGSLRKLFKPSEVKPYTKEEISGLPTALEIAQRRIKEGEFKSVEKEEVKPIQEVKPKEEFVKSTDKYAGSINLTKYPEKNRQIIADVVNYIGKERVETLRGRRGIKETFAKASKPEKIAEMTNKALNGEIKPNTVLNDVDMTALRMANKSAQDYLTENWKKLSETDNRNYFENVIEKLTEAEISSKSASGRSQRILQEKITGKYTVKQLEKQRKEAVEAGEFKISEMIDKEIANVKLNKPTWISKFIEFRRNNLLTAGSSIVRSLVGNTVNLTWTTLDMPLAGAYDMVFTNLGRGGRKVLGKRGLDSRSRSMWDIVSFTAGTVKGFRSGASTAYSMLKGDRKAVDNSIMYQRENFRTEGAIGGKWGKIVRTPQRVQGAIDILYREPATVGFVHNYAWLKATKEGFSGEAWRSRVKEIIENPTDKMLKEAKESAQFITFQKELGAFGKGLNQLRVGKMEAGQLIVPFFNTMANLYKTGYARSPLGLFSKTAVSGFKEGMKYGDWGKFSDRSAQFTSGTLALFGIYKLTSSLIDNVQGSWDDKTEAERKLLRSQKKQPNSIEIYNEDGTLKWSASFEGYEPLSSYLRVAGAINEGKKLNESDYEILKRASVTYIRDLKENPFFQGVEDIYDLTDKRTDGMTYATRFIKSSLMPNLIFQTRAIIDPYNTKTPRKPEALRDWGDPKQWKRRIKREFPVLTKDVYRDVDILGIPIPKISPKKRMLAVSVSEGVEKDHQYTNFTLKAKEKALILKELERLDLGNIRWSAQYKDIELNEEQEMLLKMSAGEMFVKHLHEKMFTEPVYEYNSLGDKFNKFKDGKAVRNTTKGLTSEWTSETNEYQKKFISKVKNLISKYQKSILFPEIEEFDSQWNYDFGIGEKEIKPKEKKKIKTEAFKEKK